jgi:hypothetical protein
VHHSSSEHCWALPDVVTGCQTAARGVVDFDCHTAMGIWDVAGSGSAKGTGHGSTD